MQVVSTVPTHSLNLFKHPSFRCNGSRFNPSAKPSAGPHSRSPKPFSANEMAKIHLANLEKLLRKQPDPDSGPVRPDDNSKNKPPLLEGLNVAGIWPEMKAAEEMSPRHMNRLQRLLSRTDDRSPKNALGSRWREYHGSHNWSGLLDPLDENLRREVIRYGEFVQAAYHAFHSDPATSSSSLSRHVALPDKCFKVTKSLYATSSVGLPKWVDDVAPDLGWMTQRSSWIGYVAVCDDPREIERMGRRDVVIALRGTATCLEWAENMRELLTPLPGTDGRAKVECGFLSLFKTHGSHVPSLAESVVEEVERIMEMYKGEQLSITVTGHSLGAALALLVADEISTRRVETTPPIAVFSFGGPRVGNRQFADRINGEKVKTLRIVNSQDVITKIPGVFVSEEGLKNHANAKKLLEPWAYSHVGTELRVETRMSPFLKPDADAACCHDLESYLHLVDGFLSSACPFRANAKRSLAKLLNEQGSNVKKLYTSKVKDLGSLNLKREGKNLSTCLPSPS